MTIDHLAYCVDSAIYIGLGTAVLLIGPRQIRKKSEAGKYTNQKTKTMSRIARLLGLLMIGYGAFRICSKP